MITDVVTPSWLLKLSIVEANASCDDVSNLSELIPAMDVAQEKVTLVDSKMIVGIELLKTLVGADDASIDGSDEGWKVGLLDGKTFTFKLGIKVFSIVGERVGIIETCFADGSSEREIVGTVDISIEGCIVGIILKSTEGFCDGSADGS